MEPTNKKLGKEIFLLKGENMARKWTMQNKCGQSKSKRARSQSKLKGRGCRDHNGVWPGRGRGTTSRSR